MTFHYQNHYFLISYNFHKYKYQHAKSQIKWFRIPIIILSGINTFASVGLQEHIKQGNISIISSGISLLCGIITGIEMFMKYQERKENNELENKPLKTMGFIKENKDLI